MAQVVALTTALVRLGFSQAAATYITHEQGMDSLSEFQELDDDTADKLCSTTRKPGGTIPDPQANNANPANIPNPGIPVSLRAQENLKLMCYQIRYAQRTSRTLPVADITLDNVRALRKLREGEANHENSKVPEVNEKDWAQTLDAIENFLRGRLGVTKIPLSYVVRNANQPTPTPPNGFPTRQAELIARAPIVTAAGGGNVIWDPTFLMDNERVWELFTEMMRDRDCWTHIRKYQASRDGRSAFVTLKMQYLGANFVTTQSRAAETELQNATYTGEKRRWNFDKYVQVHQEQHTILEGLVKYGYAGIDPRTKVRHLMDGIKIDSLDAVANQINANAALQTDFDRCVGLYKDHLRMKGLLGSGKPTVQVAATATSNGGQAQAPADMSVEDRYYKHDEYKALTPSQKSGLRAKRLQRGHKGGKSGPPAKKKQKLERRIKAIVTEQLQSGDPSAASSDEDDDVSDSEKTKKTSNRKNKALQRKK